MPSRQYKWSLKQSASGHCRTCGKALAVYTKRNGAKKTSVYCEKHLVDHREREHLRTKAQTWDDDKPVVTRKKKGV